MVTSKLLRRAAACLALLACGCGDPTPSAPVAIADAADRLEACEIDSDPRGGEKASDHTPIWCTLRE